MLRIKQVLCIVLCIFYQNYLSGDLVDDGILLQDIKSNNSCLVYTPYLGEVLDIESLDIKSDKFEITDNEALILNGNVVLDFPNGILKQEKQELIEKMDWLTLKKKVIYF